MPTYSPTATGSHSSTAGFGGRILPTAGLAALERGLNEAGYALRDVARIVVTHAHIDHYGLAGRLLELTGGELSMHAMTDLDCEKYRHPDTAMARRRDTYADHGVSEPSGPTWLDGHLTRWMPYLHSVVEASTAAARWRGADHRRRAVGGPAHPRPFARATCACSRRAAGVVVRRPPAAVDHTTGDLRARLRHRPSAQLRGLAQDDRQPPPGAGGPRTRAAVRRRRGPDRRDPAQ